MAERTYPFPELGDSPRAATLLIRSSGGDARGSATVAAERGRTAPEVTVRGDQDAVDRTTVGPESGDLVVTFPGSGDYLPVDVTAHVPASWSATAELAHARVDLEGPLTRVDVATRTGDVTLRGDYVLGQLRSGTGNIEVDRVPHALAASSELGDVTVNSVTGWARLETDAGRLSVNHADPLDTLSMTANRGTISYDAADEGALGRISAVSRQGEVHPKVGGRPVPPREARDRPTTGSAVRAHHRGTGHSGRLSRPDRAQDGRPGREPGLHR